MQGLVGPKSLGNPFYMAKGNVVNIPQLGVQAFKAAKPNLQWIIVDRGAEEFSFLYNNQLSGSPFCFYAGINSLREGVILGCQGGIPVLRHLLIGN